MNERIKELVEQALADFAPNCWSDISKDRIVELLGPLQQKFAELIVKDCLSIVCDNVNQDEYWSRTTAAESILAIEERFGVENV